MSDTAAGQSSERLPDLKGVPRRIITTADRDAYPADLVNYADFIVHNGVVVKDRHGRSGRDATDVEIATCKVLAPDQAKIAIDAAAWRGESPAEGTRRALILEAIREGEVLADVEALEFADQVELALQLWGQRNNPRHLIHEVLADVPVTLGNGEGGYLAKRSSLALADAVEAALLDSQIAIEALDVAGPLTDNPYLPPGYAERIVDGAKEKHVGGEFPTEARKISDEVESAAAEEGTSEVGEEEDIEPPPPHLYYSERKIWNESRFDEYRFLLMRLSQERANRLEDRLARGELIVDHVAEASAGECPDGPYDREADLLEQREASRAGEDLFMHQRNSALNLLRWLIGDLLPNGGE